VDKLGRDLGGALGMSFIPTILDGYRAILDPTEFAQPIHKSSDPWIPQQRIGA
jgi:hypothetical protein